MARTKGGASRVACCFSGGQRPFKTFGNCDMAKPATIKIRLNSTESGHFYVTKKNPRNTTEKMTFRKYDPVVRKHVEFKEAKIK